jgi:uncharacterized lipoprotein YmbA
MKTLALLSALAFTGCSSTNITKLAQQLKDDPATVSVTVSSIYGTVRFVRTNTRTNQTLTVSPDGTVSVGSR